MVYGGGGPFGIAFGAGVAKGLQATGIRVASVPALGTSAGFWVAAIMALGLDYDDFEDIIVPAVPDRTAGAVLRPARQAFGDARSPLVSAVAVCVSGGKARPYRAPRRRTRPRRDLRRVVRGAASAAPSHDRRRDVLQAQAARAEAALGPGAAPLTAIAG